MISEKHRAAKMAIDSRRQFLADEVTRKCFDARPELIKRYGAPGRQKCLQDTEYHLSYLAEAIGSESSNLFSDYIAWAKVLLVSVRVPTSDLVFNLEVMRDVLKRNLPKEEGDVAVDFVEKGLSALPEMPSVLPTFLNSEKPFAGLAKDYLGLLLSIKRHEASRKILEAVEGGASIKNMYVYVFEPVQHEIGRLWQSNQITVAEEHYCTAATQLIMSQLYSRMFNSEKNGRRMLAACVGSELHEIGIRMVADFFEMEGWDTYYLGANVPAASIIKTLKDLRIDLLAISATMTYHVQAVAELIKAVRKVPELTRTKILVGGYPFRIEPKLWRRVGADGFGKTAEETLEVADKLVASSQA